jgi:hypothetical protein
MSAFLYVGHGSYTSEVEVFVHAELKGSVSEWQGCPEQLGI